MDRPTIDRPAAQLVLPPQTPTKQTIQVSNPEERAVWDGYLTAAEQEVPLPEDDYGLYRICVHNGGAFASFRP